MNATTPLVSALVISEPQKRSRLTVAFRLILVIPHFFVLTLVSIAAVFVLLVGWFAALILGRLPERMARFLTRITVYNVRITAYFWLLTDAYPPFRFDAPEHPIQVAVVPTNLNRLAVLFRLLLAIPATVLATVASSGLNLLGVISWFAILITGRMPRPIYDATAVSVRYAMRFYTYFFLITGVYPWGLFGDRAETPVEPAPAEPMPAEPVIETTPEMVEPVEAGVRPRDRFVLGTSARVWLILAMIAGLGAQAVNFLSSPFVADVAANALLVSEYEELNEDISPVSARARNCTTLACLQTASADIERGLRAFAEGIDEISFPDHVRAEVIALQRATDAFAAVFAKLAGAPSLDRYEEIAEEDHLDLLGTLFDQRVQELSRALVGE